MKYLELIIKAPHDEVEIITSELMEMGITATEIRDNAVVDEIMEKQNKYDWDYIDASLVKIDRSQMPELRIYFEDNKEGRQQKAQVEMAYKDHNIEEITVDEEDWINSYKEHFKSLQLTSRVMVRPSWEEKKDIPGIKVMELDPGMAFGTGDHETTSMCARLMEEAGCIGKTVLDVGTGSGILAIAAALLDSEHVLGVDIDPLAVKIAKENVERNSCQNKVEIREGDLTKGLNYKADVVVANLMAEMVCMLTAHIKEHMNSGGIYISSGILTEKKQMVIDEIEKEGMKVINILDEGDWSAIAAKYE